MSLFLRNSKRQIDLYIYLVSIYVKKTYHGKKCANREGVLTHFFTVSLNSPCAAKCFLKILWWKSPSHILHVTMYCMIVLSGDISICLLMKSIPHATTFFDILPSGLTDSARSPRSTYVASHCMILVLSKHELYENDIT